MSLDVELYAEIDLGGPIPHRVIVFEANYTHNVGKMADAAGIYNIVWRPDECEGITCAGDMIFPLLAGIEKMEDCPAYFRGLNPENGWGDYDTFLPWLLKYWRACVKYPKAKIYVSR